MPTTPHVSIVVPVYSDEERIGDTLRSCTSQSLAEIEIICVDRSTGSAVVEQIAKTEPRIRLVRAPAASAAEAHRVGVSAAAAPYVLFLDAPDELESDAAARAHRAAMDADADLVGFGSTRSELHDEDILRQLFPEHAPVDDQNLGMLCRTELLRTVYEALPDGSAPGITDNLPIMLLACAASTTYVSDTAPLYRRHVARDAALPSGDNIAQFRSVMSTVGSLAIIEPVVREWARRSPNPEPLVDGYEALRLRQIASALDKLQHVPDDLIGPEAARLYSHVDEIDAIAAAATFAPTALPTIAHMGDRVELGRRPMRSVLLTTNILTTGGVSGVLRTQAQVLLDAGYRVTIAAHRPGSDESAVPDGATLIQLSGPVRHRLNQWDRLCRQNDIDVVIDHRILYSRDWPGYALAARASGAATIGWIHNFAGRPTYNGNDLHSLLKRNLDALAQLVVLSPLDVAFWKLRGIGRVVYLPNPPSPLLLGSTGTVSPKVAPTGRRLELVWWGRLEQHTKKVTELIELAAALKRLGADFRLRIIGPDWADMSAARLSALAAERGVEGFIDVTGPRRGQDLLDAIDSSDIFVNTSIIEGYPLTVPEAQARGLPIAMYDLPWLALLKDNAGVTVVPQGDADALAAAVVAIAADPGRYEAMSRASVKAGERATAYDFALLYQQLISGALPAEFSPEPTLEDGRKALDLLIFFAEKSAAAPIPAARNGGAEQGRPRRRSQPRSLSGRFERRLTPVGHRVLGIAPWLRPAARRVKLALLPR